MQRMPSITIKSISPALHARLKGIARRHHRSLQNEIVACLERHAESLPRSKAELMAEAAALRDRLPYVDHDLVALTVTFSADTLGRVAKHRRERRGTSPMLGKRERARLA